MPSDPSTGRSIRRRSARSSVDPFETDDQALSGSEGCTSADKVETPSNPAIFAAAYHDAFLLHVVTFVLVFVAIAAFNVSRPSLTGWCTLSVIGCWIVCRIVLHHLVDDTQREQRLGSMLWLGAGCAHSAMALHQAIDGYRMGRPPLLSSAVVILKYCLLLGPVQLACALAGLDHRTSGL